MWQSSCWGVASLAGEVELWLCKDLHVEVSFVEVLQDFTGTWMHHANCWSMFQDYFCVFACCLMFHDYTCHFTYCPLFNEHTYHSACCSIFHWILLHVLLFYSCVCQGFQILNDNISVWTLNCKILIVAERKLGYQQLFVKFDAHNQNILQNLCLHFVAD